MSAPTSLRDSLAWLMLGKERVLLVLNPSTADWLHALVRAHLTRIESEAAMHDPNDPVVRRYLAEQHRLSDALLLALADAIAVCSSPENLFVVARERGAA